MYDSKTIIKLLCLIVAAMLLALSLVLSPALTGTAGMRASTERVIEARAAESSVEAYSAAAKEMAAHSAVTVIDSPGGSTRVVQEWAENFYLQRSLCGASEVRDVAIRDDSVLVRLDIDPQWEMSLNKLGKKAAGQWFAIHCPLPVATAEHALGQRDINIVSTSADNPHTSFSCRSFERTLRKEAARTGGFRAKVNALLQRLGVASP